MTDNSKKISQLPAATNISGSDKLLILSNPSGNVSTRTIDWKTLSSNLLLSNNVPANSSSNGITGTIRFDTNYAYICIANNTWKRFSLDNF